MGQLMQHDDAQLGRGAADPAAKLALYEAAFEKARAVCSEAAKGNLEARITEIAAFGEIGEVLLAINRMLDLTDAFVREAGTSLTYASEGKFFRRFVLRGMLGDFRRGAMTINTAREDMEKKARQAAAAEAEAERQRQREREQAEAAKQRLAIAEGFGSKVGAVVQTVAASAAEMEATAKEMAKLAGNAHQQSLTVSTAAATATENVQTVAAAAEQLTASISEIGGQVNESTRATRGAVDGMDSVNAAVQGLAEAAEQIDKVVEFIRGIAGQTNLLALNATIEAAR
ncbi:MAG TPA: methyl-accepting chemotaxis protein, partial [Kiloniellales bacterium]